METEISNTNPLYYQDASGLANMIRTRQVSAVEVMKAHLDRIDALNPSVNAVVTIAANALEEAKAADAAVSRGDELGPLHGVPFTVKDSIDTLNVLPNAVRPSLRDAFRARMRPA